MNGIHDMGGMDGFGEIELESHEPVFHSSWEGRILAIQRAMTHAGAWTVDMSRFAQERLPPQTYLAASYYYRWMLAMEANVIDQGLVTSDELAAGHSLQASRPLKRKLSIEDVKRGLTRGSFARDFGMVPRFAVGDRVRAKNTHPATHTRLPRYARGRVGTIDLLHGCHVFADSVGMGGGEDPQWLYTVRFNARELWGPEADCTMDISIDAYEAYLESP